MTVSGPENRARSARGRAGWGTAAVLAGVGTIVALLISGMVLIPRYRAAYPASSLQRSDADRVPVDDLYLDLTIVTPKFLASRDLTRFLGDRDPRTVLPLIVGVNTHKGSIEHMHHLHGAVYLVGADGARYPALTEPIVLTEHHNAYMLLFPPRDNHGRPFLHEGTGSIVVEATGMGKAALRRFEWTLPLDEHADTGLLATLTLVVALAGALLVVLSPCALELTLYYTAIISATIDESEKEAMARGGLGAVAGGRRRVLTNLGSFVAGFTLLYSAAGATVGLIGQGVRRPLGEYAFLIQIAGGGLILFFALRILGVDRWIGRGLKAMGLRLPAGGQWLGALRGRLRALLLRVRFRGENRAAARGTMRAADSFLVGIGLSSACLGCMGGAVLYPLLVYAGITSWYSGLVTLALYSLAIALPMVAIALGFAKLRFSLASKLGLNRTLKLASGGMLAGIGLLILTGRERVITDVTFGFLAAVVRWFG
jgi:cytochrome c biogenesis protein CcdA